MKYLGINKLAKVFYGFLICLCISCEGSLEPEVYNQLSVSNFPKTAEDAKVLVNGIYFEFRNGPWNRYNAANDSRLVNGLFCTDEFSCYWGAYWAGPFEFLWQPDQSPYTDLYNGLVPAITKATTAIELLKNVKTIDNTLKERYIAEIRASRGYWLYDLFNMYGPVPTVLNGEDAINISNYKPTARPTLEEMVLSIEKDLTDAARVLPVSYPSSDYGRMTKGAALMGLLKLYLHEKDWIKVEKTARDIIGLGVYGLQADYKSIWSINNEQNNEIIFAIPCIATDDGLANNFRAHVLPADWTSPNGYPVTGWNGYKVPWEFYDTYDKDDKRRALLQRYYLGANGQTIDARVTSPLGAIPIKYGEDPVGTGQNQGTDYVIYRYADVLLSLAEALNEQNGPNEEAVSLIRQVRVRAFTVPKPIAVSDFASKAALRDRILAERGWELCFEGNRREDLIRHGKFIEFGNDPDKMSNRNPRKNATARNLVYPIPNSAIFQNPLIKQNPGY